jgi:hypothetical protein
MDTNPDALQQMLIKGAVGSALNKGLDFVALTSLEHSAQPQLYKRLPENAQTVVRDLGDGFEVKEIELKNDAGPFKTLGIVWNQSDASGREGVNRLLTQGVPFKEGGLVDSKVADEVLRSQEELLREQLARIDNTPSTRTPERAPTPEQTESRAMLERLDAATPVERAVFESTGMEPGLDRASILPFAGSREEGNLQLAAPGFVYDAARAFVTPGMAARGQRVSDEDILNTAMNVMGGGAGASRVAGPRTASDEVLLGMGVGSKEAPTAAGDLAALTGRSPLDMSTEARMQRAADEGYYPETYYHGTSADFDSFDPLKADPSRRGAIFITNNPAVASTYARTAGSKNVMPLMIRPENPIQIYAGGANWNKLRGDTVVELPARVGPPDEGDVLLAELRGVAPPTSKEYPASKSTLKELFPEVFRQKLDGDGTINTNDLARWAQYQGADSLIFHDIVDIGPTYLKNQKAFQPSKNVVMFDPKKIRSVNAAFDPAKRDSSNITFAKGGEVSSAKDMLDRLTSAR